MKPTSEHDVQSAVIRYLAYNGFFVWRNNSGMVRQAYKGKQRMIRLGIAGMPDVLAVKDGQLYAFEIKLPKNKPTPLQLRRHEELTQHGAKVFVTHSLDELMEQLKDKPMGLAKGYKYQVLDK